MRSRGSCGAGGVHRVDLVMAIRAAMVVMAIKADICGYCDHTYLKTDMAIVTVLGSKPTWLL